MTELFLSDVHGEYEEFSHILRSACGGIRRAIDEAFGDASEEERAELATLVAYPREKLELMLQGPGGIIALLSRVLPRLQELRGRMAGAGAEAPKLSENPAKAIVELCAEIQRIAVSRVHVVGDIYDRGPHPDLIMDELAARDDVDIQWGNHDILWMGAALGQPGCVANVVRICARYGNLSVLEDTYGIDLSPLTEFALSAYADDPCVAFGLKGSPDLPPEEVERQTKIQKAMAIIQFKAEARLIDENPSFGLESRKLLHRIDFAHGNATVEVDGGVYEMLDTVLPTVDAADPYALTDGEAAVLGRLEDAFRDCEKLQRHIRVFLEKGSLYKIVPGEGGRSDTLLFHACVPLEADGSLKEVGLYGKTYRGRALYDAVDSYVRDAFEATDPEARKRGADLVWYLWLGSGSPLFAKSKMATFELYFVADKAVRKERKNAFYELYEDPDVLAGIFEDFGMDPKHSRIVCGHVPVKVKDGEDPVKCGGRLIDIDGGMSRPYQSKTGIAGFTLVSGDDGVFLATHEPFAGTRAAIEENAELKSSFRRIE